MVKISVILPAFNSQNYIEKAIGSVLAQKFVDFELIIVNDGSTDSTLDIISSFSDNRITIIDQPNQGPGAARNNALKIANGDYVMYLDSDDWFCPDALDIAYAEITKFDADLTFFQMINYNGEKYYGNDWFDMKTFDESFENRAFKPSETPGSIFDLSVGVCQKIYNRNFLEKINAKFLEGIFFEDMPFFYYVYLKAERISIIKMPLYVRRKHEKSITNVVDEKFFDTVPAGQELMRIFIENGWYDAYKFDLLAYKINGPRFALRDMPLKYKSHMFDLIKRDYESIKSTKYYEDFLTQLGPVKKKFFLDVLKSGDYEEFSKTSR
ncbi:MAG: glycosyltransferase family 2 protein [Methanobrevibacter thaueri]|uniref:Glycosyltransferase family 2 protein n=1 Tax=Methanobrevibacter thaueri TaxID=190975 RepID=A0A8T3V3F0_9EURY|nr:glycosyltransferase family 2 protein [Methanobrevibacter thaueri]MBE6501062.1 glycosyltransferase family 2 protein [Methanobrevibacter thaueri]